MFLSSTTLAELLPPLLTTSTIPGGAVSCNSKHQQRIFYSQGISGTARLPRNLVSIFAWSSAITITRIKPGCPPSFLPRHPRAPAWRRWCCKDLKQVWFSAFTSLSQKGGTTAYIHTLSTESPAFHSVFVFHEIRHMGKKKGKEKK